MIRKHVPYLAVLAALSIVLGSSAAGCGGGGSKGSSGTTGTDGTTVGDAAGIVRDINSKPGTGAKVTFFSASGSTLGSTTITESGNAGAPPAGSTRFSVDLSAIKAYYAEYYYNGLYYDATLANCNPGLTNGQFASSIVLTPRTAQAPPAPDGCSGG